MSFKIFGLLAQKNINVDIILQSTGRDGKKDISFTCAEGEAETPCAAEGEVHASTMSPSTTCAKVSIVGAGMQSHPAWPPRCSRPCLNQNINIKMISTSEIKICVHHRPRRRRQGCCRHPRLFLAGCAAVVALLTGGILWLLPKVHGLLAGPKVFAASVYDGTDYVFNAADARCW